MLALTVGVQWYFIRSIINDVSVSNTCSKDLLELNPDQLRVNMMFWRVRKRR